MISKRTRVRFAPSPTGPLHIGGVRTALYNYLFARHMGGDFILRIEDTDQNRYVPGAEQYIIDSLLWCGLKPDEGPGDLGGVYGPYRQSERKAMYKQYADMLIASGDAYYAFDTTEELEVLRKEAEDRKQLFTYNVASRLGLNNSLTFSKEELERRLTNGENYVIRFKIPENGDIQVHDIIRGDITFHLAELDDKVLYKSDGMPTYHLANIVDDRLMQITHVIRGEEWLSSMPLHILLYKAFGWEAPQFAHLPLILKPSGNGKLSKRDGDQGGFPVFPLQWNAPNGDIFSGYKEKGYVKEGFINMLAMLGWNDGTDQEIYSIDELVEAFSLDKVGKSGSRFDPEKTRWFNQQYIHALSDDEFFAMVEPVLLENGFTIDTKARRACLAVKDRCSFPSDIVEHARFFFCAPTEYDPVVIKKRWKEGTADNMLSVAQLLQSNCSLPSAGLHDIITEFISENGLNMGVVMNCLRLSLVGAAKGPDLFEIIDIIGVDQAVDRIRVAAKKIGI